SYSTVSGKKSMPSRGSDDETAVASSTESPYVTSTAPSARPATRPVSSVSVRPASSISSLWTATGIYLLNKRNNAAIRPAHEFSPAHEFFCSRKLRLAPQDYSPWTPPLDRFLVRS